MGTATQKDEIEGRDGDSAAWLWRRLQQTSAHNQLLQREVAELEAKNAELACFAQTVAHELKEPLTLLLGFATYLEFDFCSLEADEIQRHLASLSRCSRRLATIVDELLLLATLPSDRLELEPLPMAELVAGAQDRLAHLIADHNAQILAPDSWPLALGRAAWIEEVWVNYLSNAIRYGGKPPCVLLGASREAGGMIRFWIQDNGAGLSAADQARLFTPFERLDCVQLKGHGLGLAIVHHIVRRLGGQVGVASTPGQGSIFSFTLAEA